MSVSYNYVDPPPQCQLPPPRSSDLLAQRQDVRHGPQWGDGQRVDLGVRLGVVVLDVEEVGGVAERRQVPVQVAHPVVDGRVARADVADVALEVLDIDGLGES